MCRHYFKICFIALFQLNWRSLRSLKESLLSPSNGRRNQNLWRLQWNWRGTTSLLSTKTRLPPCTTNSFSFSTLFVSEYFKAHCFHGRVILGFYAQFLLHFWSQPNYNSSKLSSEHLLQNCTSICAKMT